MGFLENIFKNQDTETAKNISLLKDTQAKKESLMRSLDMELDSLLTDEGNVFESLGKTMFEKFKQDGESTINLTDFEDIFSKLKDIDLKKLAIQDKKDEITKRYDEEIDLLKKLAYPPSEQSSIVHEKVVEITCANCDSIVKDDDDYCFRCGTKLK